MSTKIRIQILLLPFLGAIAGILFAGLARDRELDVTAVIGSASCFDVVVAGDTVHLLFGRNAVGGEQLEFFHTRSIDTGKTWSTPVPVHTAHAPPGRHLRGSDPQLAVSGERLMSVWTAHGSGPWGSGPLATALSLDGGKTWQPGPAPDGESDQEGVGYRFPAVAADEHGFHAIWIHAVENERSLRHSRLDFGDAAWSPAGVIDSHICACCWNKLKVGPDGALFALYRDQEPSDMRLAMSTDRGRTWRDSGAAGGFDWHFQGCPHVGAGLALGSSDSPLLLASVWTGDPDQRGAYLLRSEDGGDTWRQSPMPEPTSWGNINTDIALLPSGRAAAVWDPPSPEGERSVFLTTSHDAGESWSASRKLSRDGKSATHPRLIAIAEKFLVLWTETDADGRPELLIEIVE